MKKILIKAYAQLNLGDDLFIKMLCERYKDTEFYLFATPEYENLKGIETNNLKILYNNTFAKKILFRLGRKFGVYNILEDLKAKELDGVVNIGGSIFIENYFSKEDFKIRERNLEFGKNYFILGANFGPYKSEAFKSMYHDFFKKCKDVCFRERYSYELFKDLENVRFGKDIVFSLKQETVAKEDYVLFSIILPSARPGFSGIESEYFNRLKTLTLDIIKSGKKVKFMSFCQGEKDEEAIKKLLNMIPNEQHKYISKYFYRGDMNEALEILNKADSIVATRFHAMILGFVLKKPVFPIAYSKKMTNVLEDLEFKQNYASLENLQGLNFEKFKENEALSPNTLIRAAQDGERHFLKLDDFLSE
ncbi:polysaccharide pyruvyl transferase family protein [Cetobacterium somerae]|uniref:polysaccharide pyruvyl transferase family protein n=1 Tax=Cetobacterium somerae TaxID=188913 RepID=UPI00211DC4AE|nr:polysaccharide pyruvyl transferase family protein [Cetobacterium somerae]